MSIAVKLYGILSLIFGLILTCIGLSGYLLICWGIYVVYARSLYGIPDIFGILFISILGGLFSTFFFIIGTRAIKSGIRCFTPGRLTLKEVLPRLETERLKGKEGQIIYSSFGNQVSPLIIFSLYLFASFFIVVVIMAFIATKKEGWLFGVVLCVAGFIAMTSYLAYNFLKEKKFGKSICNLKTLPVFVGGTLEAEVTVEFPKLKKFGIPDLPLSPVEIEFRNQTAHSRSLDINWMTEREISLDFLSRPGDGTLRIPMKIDIPLEVRDKVKFKRSLTETSLWKLLIKASYPGADYMSEFVVPVSPPNTVS